MRWNRSSPLSHLSGMCVFSWTNSCRHWFEVQVHYGSNLRSVDTNSCMHFERKHLFCFVTSGFAHTICPVAHVFFASPKHFQNAISLLIDSLSLSFFPFISKVLTHSLLPPLYCLFFILGQFTKIGNRYVKLKCSNWSKGRQSPNMHLSWSSVEPKCHWFPINCPDFAPQVKSN